MFCSDFCLICQHDLILDASFSGYKKLNAIIYGSCKRQNENILLVKFKGGEKSIEGNYLMLACVSHGRMSY